MKVSNDGATLLQAKDGCDSTVSAKPYYGYFDLMRAVLAVAVFISHANILPEPLDSIGGYAVRVFFALSGFLVGGILLDMRQKSHFWSALPKFYFNRCLRIWVPYYLLIMSYVALILLRDQWSSDLELRLIPLLTYTHNWANDAFGLSSSVAPINHSWSLAVEEQFYLLCPLLVGAFFNRALMAILMLVLAIALPFTLGVSYFSAICLGVFAAVMQRELAPSVWGFIQKVSLFVGMPAFLILLVSGFSSQSVLVALAGALMVVGVSVARAKSNFIFLLGAMSYSFYLFHWIGLYIANPISKKLPEVISSEAGLVIAFGIAVLISYLSVRFVEWPLIKRRDAFASQYPVLVVIATVAAFLLTLTGLLYIAAN